MKTALQIDITFDQIFELVKKLPRQEKVKLSKELEKDNIEFKLNNVLKSFKTDKLNIETINEEVEIVRQKLCESQQR
jgi:hypothetical protein